MQNILSPQGAICLPLDIFFGKAVKFVQCSAQNEVSRVLCSALNSFASVFAQQKPPTGSLTLRRS